MACTDGKNTYLNIKELPEVTDIISGDFLIVETPNATSILDFANFTITLDNTTFGDIITTNTSNIVVLSSTVIALSTKTQQDTYAVFSITDYTSVTGISLIASSNVSSLEVQNTSTSAIRIYFATTFRDNNYGYTCNTFLSSFVGPATSADLKYNYIDIFVKDRNYNITTADRVTVRILGDQLA